MGAYTMIKGWIQIPPVMKCKVEGLIGSYRAKADEFDLKPEIAEWYSSGWVFQEEPINGAMFAFYGAEIRTDAVRFIEAQVKEIARLSDEDHESESTLAPEGMFHLDEDGTYGRPPMIWLIRDGVMSESERQRIQ